MEQLLIGLCGYAQVGKDTIAGILRIPRCAFADELKNDLDPIRKRMGLDLSIAKDKRLFRPFMVEYGRLARAIDKDYWIKRLVIPETPRAIITDVRYANECKWIESKGGIVLRVVRNGFGSANDEEARNTAEIEYCYPNMPYIDNSMNDGGLFAASLAITIIDEHQKSRLSLCGEARSS